MQFPVIARVRPLVLAIAIAAAIKTSLPKYSQAQAACPASNCDADIKTMKALVVGGTSGIGYGIALALAKRGDVAITIAGRSAERGGKIVEELTRLSPDQQHAFEAVDGFNLASFKELAGKQAPEDTDILVMTHGMATTQGYTPTADGLDQKLQLHYFSRFYLAKLYAPKMKPDSRIVAVLSAGVHGKYSKFEQDFELKKHYSIKNAADAAGFYLDAGLEAVSVQRPDLIISHAAPGFVNTNWGTELPMWMRMMVRPMQKLFAKSAERCGDLLTEGFMNLPVGYSLLDEHGKTIGKKGLKHTATERDVIVAKTMELLPDLD
jgi:NAD(P)-dependent dehydrogenase (short-subunit alcohol dehydrogenase family)